MKTQLFIRRGLWLTPLLSFLLVPAAVQAKNIGGDPASRCPTCKCLGSACTQRSDTSSTMSKGEGNLTESVPVSMTRSSNGATIDLAVTYNSYNADGSRATIDSVMGYGWTHSYNIFLFNQFGAMFRYDGAGRVTKFGLGPGGTYITSTGYFETLVKNPGGTFTITQKDRTSYNFALIPGTPFLVAGPVWRLTSIVDRNANTTTLTYSGGNLQSVTDTYGRSTIFSYNAQGRIVSINDPLGRTTTFSYDSTGNLLTQITDPTEKTIQYTYNVLFQLTGKIDRDGRIFTYVYSGNEPVAVNDGAGTSPGTMSNPGNWATDPTQLASAIMRVYIPAATSVTDGRDHVWQYQYESHAYITQATAPDGATTSFTYDPATLMLASSTDADGNTSSWKYDSEGNMVQQTDALGHVTTYTYDPVFNMVTSMTDPRGRITTYTLDSHGNRVRETDPLGQIRSWTYDSHGNILTSTDQDGNTTTNQYDFSGDIIKTIDPLGNPTSSTYDAVGNVLSTTDANNHSTSYVYDGLNRKVIETDALGHSTQTSYDGESNVIQVIDRDGHTTSYQYDLRQRRIKMTDALGQLETYTYDLDDNRVTLTDKDGHTTSYGYDVQDRLITVTDALGDVSSTTYDGLGNVISVTDADGHTTTYGYDALNRCKTMTDALSEQTQYFYDTGTFTGPVTLGGVTVNCIQCGATPGSSLVTEQIDPDGTASVHAGVTFFKYDALERLVIKVQKTGCFGVMCPDTITSNDALTLYTNDPVGNLVTIVQPDGVETTYLYDADNRRIQETIHETGGEPNDVTTTTYDGVSNVISITAPNLNVTTNSYDPDNRLIQKTDSVGLAATYSYDPEGYRLSYGDGNGNVTSYVYDPLNRLVTTTDPMDKTTTWQYDPVGNPLKYTDRNGNTTTFTYDAINRRITATDALGNTTLSQYDPVGNLIKLTDANSHATQYFYDAVNRPSKETYADNLSRTFSYDQAGNLLTRTDQKLQTTIYAYSDLYFLLSRTYPSDVDSFTYDLSGRMLSALRAVPATSESWLVTFPSYDSADRVIQTVQNGQTINYSYNIPGHTRTLTYPGGRVITEHTDARTRMDHIDDALSPPSIVQYTYDLANNPLSRNYRNGTTSAYTYNPNNWTTSITHANPATFAGFNYAYDNEGNKQDEQKTQDTTHSEAYQYDSTYRLITYSVGTLVGSTVPVPTTQTSYSLDPVGNWNSKTTNGVTQNRLHNVTNELIDINATSLTYDADGNLVNDGSYTYAYDEENRLTGVTPISGAVAIGQYQYDALNRRIQKVANPAGTPVTTQYFYDGARVIEEQNGSGATQATYVYGNYVDEILNMDRGGQAYYYHQNALWSVEAVTSSTGAPVERYSYDAYGFVTVTDGAFNPVPLNSWGTPHSAIGNPWTFTGRQLDEETGLYYYRARYHDAIKGRFLQRDPIGEVLGDLNLYEFEGSNPVNATDPLGLDYTVGLLTVDEATKTFEDLGGEKGKAQRKRALDFFKLGGENKGGGRSLIRVDKNVQAGVMKTPIQENEEIEIGKGDAGGVLGFYQIYNWPKAPGCPNIIQCVKTKVTVDGKERTNEEFVEGWITQADGRSFLPDVHDGLFYLFPDEKQLKVEIELQLGSGTYGANKEVPTKAKPFITWKPGKCSDVKWKDKPKKWGIVFSLDKNGASKLKVEGTENDFER